MTALERVEYLGLRDCVRLTNGEVDVVMATAIGPRVLRYGRVGEHNVFGEWPDLTVETELGTFRPWGGHRLWAAPERMPGSYAPDDRPVEWSQRDDGEVWLGQAADAAGIEKVMAVSLAERGTEVRVRHVLTNRARLDITVAPWALSIMRPGGVAVVPQEPFRSHDDYLLPARPMVVWHFTDLADPRWTLGPRFVRLRPDPSRPQPQKVGMGNRQGWAAYHAGQTLFVKRFAFHEGGTYPDFGCNTEMYAAGGFLELESLGPLTTLRPGEATEHEERWSLIHGLDVDVDDATLDTALRRVLPNGTT